MGEVPLYVPALMNPDILLRKGRGGASVFELLPWREAGPPNHHDAKVDSDQWVVNNLFRAIFDACKRSSTARFAKSLQRNGFLEGRGLSLFSQPGRWKEPPSDVVAPICPPPPRCALSTRRQLGVPGPVPAELRRSLVGDADCVGSPC